MTVHIESTSDGQRIEYWDQQGTTEPLNGLGVSVGLFGVRVLSTRLMVRGVPYGI